MVEITKSRYAGAIGRDWYHTTFRGDNCDYVVWIYRRSSGNLCTCLYIDSELSPKDRRAWSEYLESVIAEMRLQFLPISMEQDGHSRVPTYSVRGVVLPVTMRWMVETRLTIQPMGTLVMRSKFGSMKESLEPKRY